MQIEHLSVFEIEFGFLNLRSYFGIVETSLSCFFITLDYLFASNIKV